MPPVSVTEDAVVDAVPPTQVVLALPVTTSPLGNVSVSGELRVAAETSALLNVIVRVDPPPARIVAGLNALPSVGGIGVIGAAHTVTDTVLESIVTAPV